MPTYDFELDVPTTNSTWNTKASKKLRVRKGTIVSIRMCFPAGCRDASTSAFLVHACLEYEGRQIFPEWTEGNTTRPFFEADDYDDRLPERIELMHDYEWMTLYAYNTDDTYDHHITVMVTVI